LAHLINLVLPLEENQSTGTFANIPAALAKMLIEPGVSAQVAEDVRISLQGQIAPKASKNESSLGAEDRQAYITLKDTWEVQDLRKAIKRVRLQDHCFD
jgi:hypothetical protein